MKRKGTTTDRDRHPDAMAEVVETATNVVSPGTVEEDPVPTRETTMVAHASSKKAYASTATRKVTSESTVLKEAVEVEVEVAGVLQETAETGATIATEAIDHSESAETMAVETITDPVVIGESTVVLNTADRAQVPTNDDQNAPDKPAATTRVTAAEAVAWRTSIAGVAGEEATTPEARGAERHLDVATEVKTILSEPAVKQVSSPV